MQSLIKIYLAMSVIFMAISCSQVRFKKSDKDICLGDDRMCVIDPSTQDLFFDYTETVPYPDNRVDVLFVVDNSKSMMDDQIQMANRFYDFMSSISHLDWRIAITTTDTRVGPEEYKNGKLVPFKNSSGQTVTYVLDKSIPNFELLFRNTIQRRETQDCIWYYQHGEPLKCDVNGDERGIHAAILAMTRNEHGFLRSGAPFRVVIISDEDERSNGGLYPNLPLVDNEDYAEDLVRIANSMGKSMVAYSIVVPSGDNSCLTSQQNNSYNDATFPGKIYEKLSQLTGGLVGSVCAPSYTTQLQAISRDIDDGVRDTIQNLPCVPKNNEVELFVPANAAQSTTIFNVTTRSFSVNPPLLPGQSYRLRLTCQPL